MNTNQPKVDCEKLLKEAIEKPGLIMQAYSLFHRYSTGNQMLAIFECLDRGLTLGPINTFKGWQAIGRNVKKGSKAIGLCMPVTCKVKDKNANVLKNEEGEDKTFSRFIIKNNWFVLSQTEGEELLMGENKIEGPGEWKKAQALAQLDIQEIAFEGMDGNCQGYARDRSIAVSPIAQLPFKTLFHELAHILLGHTSEGQLADSEMTPKNIREVEAEAVALICLESLQLPGAEFCRGYIQNYLQGQSIAEKSARKIMSVADKILKAGTKKLESINS